MTENVVEAGGIFSHLWRSPWTTWIGFRYLKSKKNSRFLSFITLLSILGVGLGVTAMIVVLSVMDGFEAELKKRMMTSDLHVLIQPMPQISGYDSGFVPQKTLDPSSLKAQLRLKLPDHDVDSINFWPVISTEAILKSGRKVTGVVMKGVTESRLTELKKHLTEIEKSQPDISGIYVGQELAYELGVIPGDSVTLVSPTEMEGPLGNIPRLKRYGVAGIYHTGMPEQELNTIYAADTTVRAFIRKADAVSQWEVSVEDFDKAPSIADKIRKLIPDFRVQDWAQMNAHLFASLRLERFAMSVILAFIIIVASFNIVTTLTLMVLEKTREISILKAMGARNSQVAAIFAAEGLFIGVLGVGGGVIFAWILCMGLKRFEFITLPEIYYDRTLPVTFDIRYYVIVSLCALMIVFIACLYPSRRAAKLEPLNGIRFGA